MPSRTGFNTRMLSIEMLAVGTKVENSRLCKSSFVPIAGYHCVLKPALATMLRLAALAQHAERIRPACLER
jgi:hypothetical protein